jgi:hypothetical protein
MFLVYSLSLRRTEHEQTLDYFRCPTLNALSLVLSLKVFNLEHTANGSSD